MFCSDSAGSGTSFHLVLQEDRFDNDVRGSSGMDFPTRLSLTRKEVDMLNAKTRP